MTLPGTDLNAPVFGTDKYRELARLRARHWIAEIPNGRVVLTQEAALHVLKCDAFRFSFVQIDQEASPYLATAIDHELLNKHGDAHDRLARLVRQALRDRIIADLRTRITRLVDTLIDAMPDAGEIDACADFADPFPAQVLGPMFDIPYDDVDGLNDWIRIGGRKVDALQSGVGLAEVEAANRRLHDYLRQVLAARRLQPGDDIFSALMLAEIDGDRLGEDELVFLASEMAAAGVDTTRAQLPLILDALLDHPRELEKLRADPALALRAVDEGMRFAPLPWALPHTATTHSTYKDQSFAPGDLVMVSIPAANRDPAAIPDPDRFDITRDRVRNLSFGHGMHACPGAQLARMEMSVALARLVERVPVITRAAPPTRDRVQKGEAPICMPLHITRA